MGAIPVAARAKVVKKKGARSLDSVIAAIRESAVTVGIHSDTGTEDDGKTSMVTVAIANEFGTEDEHIPERSFMRSTFDENVDAYKQDIRQIVKTAASGGRSIRQGMGLLGRKVENQVKAKIVDIREPGNAPATIKQKGFDNPLVHHGRLGGSVRWKYLNE